MKINDAWTVYIRTPAGDSTGWRWAPLGTAEPLTRGAKRWSPLKLAREPRQRPGRNAYQLNFSLIEQRLAEGKDYKLLVQREPELAALLGQCLPAMLQSENSVVNVKD